MKTMKIRTGVASLAATLALVAVAAPAASGLPSKPHGFNPPTDLLAPTDGTSTRKNDGRFKKSVEANKRRLCSDLRMMYGLSLSEAEKNSLTEKGSAGDYRDAGKARADAKKLGCGWTR